MIKYFVLILGLLHFNQIIPTVVNNITLPGSRTRDLIICNDNTEFYLNKQQFPLPWTKITEAISNDLLHGLSANQLILCTKSLWRNVQFLGEMWQDFATLSKDDLIKKYQHLSKQPAQEFLQKLNQYEPCIKEIHKLYTILNGTIVAHSTQPLSQISHAMDNAMQPFATNQYEWQTNNEVKNNLTELFTTYTLYQLALANNYSCKEITPEFVLFIPKQLLQQPMLDPQLSNITNQENITPSDIWLGLQYSSCNDYNFLRILTEEQAKTLGDKIKNQTELGKLLLTVLQKLMVQKSALKKDFQDFLAEALPNFNIFLSGHGSYTSTTAEISITLTYRIRIYAAKNSKTNKTENKQYVSKSSDFLDILNFFNNQLFMKSLMVSSCYPAGKKLVDTFNITSKLQNPILEKLSYPIIMKGSSFAPTASVNWITKLPPFQNYDMSAYIYPVQKKYGPSQVDGKEAFTRFFNFLNGTVTYEKFETTEKSKAKEHKNIQRYRLQDPHKKQPATETFTATHASLLHAANVFSHIYDPKTHAIDIKFLNNYILIKFPHTEWFTPARFKESVLKLSPITMMTKKDVITVTGKIQTILMEANTIPAKIIIHNQIIPAFIPINHLNQNYVFDEIHATQFTPLVSFISQFLTIQDIHEPINIVIKNLIIGSTQFSNVYIFICNNLGAKGFRNGYIYTNATNQTSIVDWAFDQPSSTLFKTTEPFLPQTATNLIAKVISNSQKTTIPSKNIMQKLEETIAHKKAIGKMPENWKAYKSPLITALELAATLQK